MAVPSGPSVGDVETRVRAVVSAVLLPSDRLPIQPLIDIIVKYAFTPNTVIILGGTFDPGFNITDTRFDHPQTPLLYTPSRLLITDYLNHCVRQFDPEAAAGRLSRGDSDNRGRWDTTFLGIAESPDTMVAALSGPNSSSYSPQSLLMCKLYYPESMAVVPCDNSLLITEYAADRLRRMFPSAGLIQTLAGGFGSGNDESRFNGCRGVAVSPDSSFAVVCDEQNHRIMRVELSHAAPSGRMKPAAAAAAMSHLAGQARSSASDDADGGLMTGSIRFPNPIHFDVDSNGKVRADVLIVGTNCSLKRVDLAAGTITAIPSHAGAGVTVAGLAIAGFGKFLVADSRTSSLYLIDERAKTTTLFAGKPDSAGARPAPALSVALRTPKGLAVSTYPGTDEPCVYFCDAHRVMCATGAFLFE